MATKTETHRHVLYGGEVEIDFYPNSHQYKLVKDGVELEKKTNIDSVTSVTKLLDKSQALIPWALKTMKKRAIELLGDNEGATYTYQELLSLLDVAEQAPTEEKERAAGIGDYVHTYAEEYSKDCNAAAAYDRMVEQLGMPTDADKVKIDAGVVGLTKWLTDHDVEILESEQLVYSRKHGYTGTFDAVVRIKGKTYLVDYKTSNGVYDEYYYQCSAYLKAKEEETGIKFAGAIIVAIVKEDNEKKGTVAGQILPEFRTRQDLLLDFAAFKGLLPVKRRCKQLQAAWYAKNKKK